MLSEIAPTARVPKLWIYGENDSHYDAAHIRENHSAFLGAGGDARLQFFPVPGDGHFVIGFPGLWRPLADAYLHSRMPT